MRTEVSRRGVSFVCTGKVSKYDRILDFCVQTRHWERSKFCSVHTEKAQKKYYCFGSACAGKEGIAKGKMKNYFLGSNYLGPPTLPFAWKSVFTFTFKFLLWHSPHDSYFQISLTNPNLAFESWPSYLHSSHDSYSWIHFITPTLTFESWHLLSHRPCDSFFCVYLMSPTLAHVTKPLLSKLPCKPCSRVYDDAHALNLILWPLLLHIPLNSCNRIYL